MLSEVEARALAPRRSGGGSGVRRGYGVWEQRYVRHRREMGPQMALPSGVTKKESAGRYSPALALGPAPGNRNAIANPPQPYTSP